ncbi:MAG: hypothetical protein HY327_09875 [Chloroflexi bacterium]|nr:hypothetical protein [Chloroflexota bacterium]
MSRTRTRVLFVLLPALLLACDLASLPFVGDNPSLDQLAEVKATAEAAATLAAQVIATNIPATPAAKGATAQPKAGVTPPTGQQAPTDPLSQSLDALGKLNSFHYKWVSDSTATKSGKAQNVVLSVEGDVSRNPAAQHVTFRAAGQPDLLENICIGNDAWIKVRNQWTKITTAAAIGCKQFDWSTVWSGVYKNIKKVQGLGAPELKNGELAWHYKVVESNVGVAPGGVGSAVIEGDYWISVARGYPLSFVYKANVKDAAGDAATVVINWDVTNVDKPVNIQPPK